MVAMEGGGAEVPKLRSALVLSFGFWGIFCAFSATQNLESSLNSAHGLGSVSLGMIYLSFVLWCIPGPRIVKRLSCRASLMVGGGTYVLYILANLTHFLLHYNNVLSSSSYDGFYLLVPTALVLGFGAAILWSAQGTYLTNVAGQEELGKYNGIFFFIFQSTQIVGNLISALVLGKTASGVYTKSEVVLFIVFVALSVVGVCGFYSSVPSKSAENRSPRIPFRWEQSLKRSPSSHTKMRACPSCCLSSFIVA